MSSHNRNRRNYLNKREISNLSKNLDGIKNDFMKNNLDLLEFQDGVENYINKLKNELRKRYHLEKDDFEEINDLSSYKSIFYQKRRAIILSTEKPRAFGEKNIFRYFTHNDKKYINIDSLVDSNEYSQQMKMMTLTRVESDGKLLVPDDLEGLIEVTDKNNINIIVNIYAKNRGEMHKAACDYINAVITPTSKAKDEIEKGQDIMKVLVNVNLSQYVAEEFDAMLNKVMKPSIKREL